MGVDDPTVCKSYMMQKPKQTNWWNSLSLPWGHEISSMVRSWDIKSNIGEKKRKEVEIEIAQSWSYVL
jgi:hypothetical protein